MNGFVSQIAAIPNAMPSTISASSSSSCSRACILLVSIFIGSGAYEKLPWANDWASLHVLSSGDSSIASIAISLLFRRIGIYFPGHITRGHIQSTAKYVVDFGPRRTTERPGYLHVRPIYQIYQSTVWPPL